MQKLLVVLPRVPWPLEKGDKLRAYHQLRYLSQHFQIFLVALSEGQPHPEAFLRLKPFCRVLHFVSLSWPRRILGMLRAIGYGWPLQVGYFFHPKARKKIHTIIHQHQPHLAYFQLTRTGPYIKNLSLPVYIDFQDTFSAGMKRRRDKAIWWLKPFFHFEYIRMKRYEAALLDQCSEAFLISLPDRQLFPHPQHDRIHIVPNGVDFYYFSPDTSVPKKDWVLFTGNMSYPPNVDAARYLAQEIMPKVWNQHPSAQLILAGATPHPSLKALQNQRIIVTGWVNDMREYYNQASVFVAPMRMGTGLQNKLLEALAMHLPCVTSPLANHSLGARDKHEILIGAHASEFAEHISRLLSDKNYAYTLAHNGWSFVKTHYSWETATQHLVDTIKQTLD